MKHITLTTTLALLRKHDACQSRYDHLVAALGPKWGDKKIITLETILDLNGLDDAIWALRAVSAGQEKYSDRLVGLYACDCAEHVLPIWEAKFPDDDRPKKSVEVGRAFVLNPTDKNRARAAEAAAQAVQAAEAAHAAEAAVRAAHAAGAAWAVGVAGTAWAAWAAWAARAAHAAGAAWAVGVAWAERAARAARVARAAEEKYQTDLLISHLRGKVKRGCVNDPLVDVARRAPHQEVKK